MAVVVTAAQSLILRGAVVLGAEQGETQEALEVLEVLALLVKVLRVVVLQVLAQQAEAEAAELLKQELMIPLVLEVAQLATLVFPQMVVTV